MIFEVVALQIAVETGAANAEDLPRAQAIAIAHLQHLPDVHPTDFIERERTPVRFVGKRGPWLVSTMAEQLQTARRCWLTGLI